MAPPPAQAFEKSVFVFIGKRTSITPIEGEEWLVDFTFDVDQVYKGEVSKTFVVRAQGPHALSGRNFEVSVPYLVYAKLGKHGGATDSLCSRSRPLEDAKTDLLWLKKHAKAQAPKAASKKAEQPPKVGASNTTVGPSTSPGEKAKLKTEQAPLRTAPQVPASPTPVAPPSRGCATVEHGSGLSGLLLACGIMGLRRRRRR